MCNSRTRMSVSPVCGNLPAFLPFPDRGTERTLPAADLHVGFEAQVLAEVQALRELGSAKALDLRR